ncbi:Site-specific recombinase XerD [Flavobacterium omnivorum]|uniref:Site-specific recombinase XerD n=1 Tax=Flavobacterium omnivorum TaxID=178355 RepID=A0A1G7YFQ7_9FLAO|nr:tyrosine-type recombinase/integrase [Flavobacterium omnivorum]SDG95176.1 Site-specific recombinase XerD [Flavobacterium omnivorum]
MNTELFYDTIESRLRNDNFSESTIKLYVSGIKRFTIFTKKNDVNEIDNNDLAKFSKSLFKNKSLKNGTLRPIKYGINYGFNTILNKNLDVNLIPIPKSISIPKEYFTKQEIAHFFQSISNKKHKAIFEIMYALGIDTSEVINLRITDLNSKKRTVTIRDNTTKIKRVAFLPASILENLRDYYKIYKPTLYLFEGQNEGSQLSDRTIQHTFRISVEKNNFNKVLTTRSIKNSHIKHLTEDGIPLNNILEELNIKSTETLKLFNDVCFPTKKYNSSPFDTLQMEQKNNSDFLDTTDLEYILSKVTDEEERDYLKEGLRCFKANALRAGVIFLWTASVYKIQKMCLTQSLGFINTELKKIYPKAKEIKVIDDFGYIKDEYLLELACKLKLLDKTKKEELKNTCLDLRNKCGHPGKYKPKGQKIKAFVEDIIGMLY